MCAPNVSKLIARLLHMTYRFHELDDVSPLRAEDVINEVYQLLVLAPPLWVTETEHLVGRTTLSHTRHR